MKEKVGENFNQISLNSRTKSANLRTKLRVSAAELQRVEDLVVLRIR